MTITLTDINKLRALTAAGILDCKRALTQTNNDFNEAIQVLRKKGLKINANITHKEITQGVTIANVNKERTTGVLITLNCETEQTAQSTNFINLATAISAQALIYNVTELKDLFIKDLNAFNEKIEITVDKLEGTFVDAYTHTGNKIATLVALSDNNSEVARNIAMQIAATNPIALDETKVSAHIIEREIEINKHLLRQEGKPEALLEKIAKGKLNKFFKDNTLINQEFIKDSTISIAQYIKSKDKKLSITDFKRISL